MAARTTLVMTGWGAAALMILSAQLEASTTVVGNGDDGSDLEGATKLVVGKIVDTRGKTLELLNRLGAGGVRGLGNLIPEVRSTTLYMAKMNVAAKEEADRNPFHSNMRGQIYARTFARPHAETRFFPIAEALDEEQLVALHVHEALHRALPADIRENEEKVTKVTLAITSPEATQDQIRETMDAILPPPVFEGARESDAASYQLQLKPSENFMTSASLGYKYQRFSRGDAVETGAFVDSMHIIQSQFYPFGGPTDAFGLGVEASLVGLEDESQGGPLKLSPTMKLWSKRGFEVVGWADLMLNTLSAKDLKNTQYGRDVLTLGVSMRKELAPVYLENRIGWSSGGTSTQKIGNVSYDYEYGSTLAVSVHGGVALWKFRLGGFGEMHLADYFRASGGTFSHDTGRYRIMSVGPELAFVSRNLKIAVDGRFLLNSTKDTSFDHLGNLFGAGVGQGSIAGSVSFFL